MSGRAVRIGLAAALLIAILAAQPAAIPEPAADHWVSVRFAGGTTDADASLAARGYRQLPVPAGMTPEAYSDWLEQQPGVLSASPNGSVTAAADPNDVFYRNLQGPYLKPIGATRGWDIMSHAEEIVVAVIDTGIDLTHEDLARNLWQNDADADTNGIDDDNNGCIDDRYGCRFINLTSKRILGCGYTSGARTGDVRDDHGSILSLGSHGTAVAGLIGARGNNLTGIAGVAWRVRLMTLKVLDCGPEGESPRGDMASVAEAIDYARRMGADIINLSLASDPGDPSADLPELRQAIEDALDEGLIIVAAAGNHGARGVGFPAAYAQYPNVIGVGASSSAVPNTWAAGSSFGGGVDLAAPGSDGLQASWLVSTIRADLGAPLPYGHLPRGTSYSTPFVTGLFALVMARNPALSMEEYIAIVQDSATPATPAAHRGNWAGAGVINIEAALASVPMTVRGEALRDWIPPPTGTPVRAFIGGVECGLGEVVTVEGVASYDLRIAADREVAGCGAPGREIELRVGDLPHRELLAWGGLNEPLVVEELQLNGIEPPPGPVIVQEVDAGWRQIAYLGPTAPLPEAAVALPESWSAIAVWDPHIEGGGAMRLHYAEAPDFAQTLPVLTPYEALWVYSEGGLAYALNLEPPPSRELQLAEGWNSIVYTGEARAVGDALAGIDGFYNQVLRYDNAGGRWDSYLPGAAAQLNDFGGMHPFNIYWIHMTEAATLTLE